jgi:hypothetical protein
VFSLLCRFALAALMIVYSPSLIAGCQGSEEQNSKALARFWAIPDVKFWKTQLVANHDKPVATLDPELEDISGKCFYRFTAYWDAGDHLHRWHYFLLSQKGKAVLVDDLEGDLITLSKWRLTSEGKVWH